jgi:hypothetical protein
MATTTPSHKWSGSIMGAPVQDTAEAASFTQVGEI